MKPSKPVKILIVHSTLHIGGAEEVTANLCRHIDRSRFDVAVCYLKEQGVVGEKIAAEGTEVIGLPRSRRFKTDYFTAVGLRKLVRTRGIRITHSHDVHALADTTACRLTTPNIRSVHTFHYGKYPHRDKPFKTIESLCWRFVDRPVAVSRVQCTNIRRLYGIPDTRLGVVWNGVDRQISGTLPEFIRRHKDAGSIIIGSINTLIEQKGMFDLLDVAARLQQQGCRRHIFLIAGEGHLRPHLEARRHELRLDGVVEFVGWVKDAARVMMDHVDVFFQPSLWEAMSIVLLEAMASGRAIVATRVGETPYMVDAGISALLSDPGDVPAMADALARLLDDDALRTRLGAAATERYARDFTASAMANRYMAVYDELSACDTRAGKSRGLHK